MAERITYGYSESLTERNNPVVEPISLAEVKDHLGLDSNAHDSDLNRLITACRIEVERLYSVSLTTKSVSVCWQTFYDDLPLPYCPVDGNVTVTDLTGGSIAQSSDRIVGVGGNLSLKGDFPEGVKLGYNTKPIGRQDINQRLVEAVGACLSEEINVNTAVKQYFNNAII